MLHSDVLTPCALDLLDRIQRSETFAHVRLAGGTALALQLGHRTSIDLDFFGQEALDPLDVEQELKNDGPVAFRTRGRRIQRYLVSGVQVDFVEYAYPWLDAPVVADGLRLASCRDIAAMKLAAITNRGTKKDFVDLAFLLDCFSLDDMLAFYLQKFSDGSIFPVLKSLVFFDDAEEDPMPNMLKPCDWETVKRRIAETVARYSPSSNG